MLFNHCHLSHNIIGSRSRLELLHVFSMVPPWLLDLMRMMNEMPRGVPKTSFPSVVHTTLHFVFGFVQQTQKPL